MLSITLITNPQHISDHYATFDDGKRSSKYLTNIV